MDPNDFQGVETPAATPHPVPTGPAALGVELELLGRLMQCETTTIDQLVEQGLRCGLILQCRVVPA
jgi:hypothetical protein